MPVDGLVLTKTQPEETVMRPLNNATSQEVLTQPK